MKYSKITIFLFIIWSGALSSANADDLMDMKKTYKRPQAIPYLDDNKYTKEKEILGKNLYFDPRLSSSGMISCSSCHNPSLGWSDGLPLGVGHGHKQLSRRSPTIINLAWTNKMMWDGRFSTLEKQALGPIGSEAEMNMNLTSLPEKIKTISGYQEMFKKAFPRQEVSNDLIAQAIAIYERGIVSEKAPFDKWINGNETAISAEAKKGFKLFNTKANCVACHSGWRFSDDSFHDIGLKSDDVGRGKYLKLKSQQFAFKTPGLRNIAERTPYMHDGSEKTLDAVIEFYNRGGDTQREGHSDLVKPLELSVEEKKQIIAFLKTLSSKDKPVEFPTLPIN